MDDVPLDTKDIMKQCRRRIRARSGRDEDNYIVLHDAEGQDIPFAVRIADVFDRDILKYDHAMMQALKKLSTPSSKYTIPARYGIIHDGIYDYNVMENLQGPTVWEAMENGSKKLSDDCANKIAEAIADLRNNQLLCDNLIKDDALTPLGHWYPQGPIFPLDYEGGRVLSGIQDFIDFMTVRFEETKIKLKNIPLTPCVITHGDLSPQNLKICPDGTIGFMDLRTSFLAPPWWEYYALHAGKEAPIFVGPLKEAMIREGIAASDKIIFDLDKKFRPWFSWYGASLARKEISEIQAVKASEIA